MKDLSAGFKITSTRIANTNKTFPNSDAWQVKVTNPEGKTLSHKFYKGYGHNGAKPELMEFLNSLVLDASFAQDYTDPMDFAKDLGYPLETRQEQRKAESVFKQCQKINERLERFLTDEQREFFRDY